MSGAGDLSFVAHVSLIDELRYLLPRQVMPRPKSRNSGSFRLKGFQSFYAKHVQNTDRSNVSFEKTAV